MPRKPKAFIDRDHPVMDAYYDICEQYTGRNLKTTRKKLEALIQQDPTFLDPYLMMMEIETEEGNRPAAEKLLDTAYQHALTAILDKKGIWPAELEWGWLENRHIIRTLLNKAIDFWTQGKLTEALELFTNLLRSNPDDNIGARNFILAIRMKMSYDKFEARFNKGGFYDMDLPKWFDRNHKKFPDDFAWWDEWCKKQGW